MSDRVGVAKWFMRGLLLFVLAFANLNDIWSPDVLPNALFAWTVVREGNVDYDEFVFRPGLVDPNNRNAPANSGLLDSEAYFFRACGESTATEPPKATRSPGGPPAPGPNDHVCSIFPPGIAFLAFPVFVPFVLAGAHALDLGLLVRVGHLAVGAPTGVLPLLAYNAVAFANPLEQGYGTKPFDTSPLVGLYGLLISPSRGLFVYEPYILFAFATIVLLRPSRDHLELRLLSLVYAWAATALLYSTYAEWWGGRVFGPRFLDDLAPALFVILAWGIGHGLLARVAARVVFGLSAAWSLLIFQAAAFVYDQNTWDLHPANINVDPSRLLDWSDPQWRFA